MDAVAAPNARRQAMLERPALEGREHEFGVFEQEVGGAGQLHRQRGVVHVGRGHALVQEARLGTDDLGDVSQEGDDVVLGFTLDLVDTVDIEDGLAAPRPDRLGGRRGNGSERGHGVGGVRLDLEHDAEAGGRRPYGGRLRARVAIYHGLSIPLLSGRRKTSGLSRLARVGGVAKLFGQAD